jgi:hypothetical protein
MSPTFSNRHMRRSDVDYELLFPGRFMKSIEFKGRDFTGLIESVETEMLPSRKGGKELKGIIGFKGVKKKWVLNRTNAECLVVLFGRDTNAWVQHRVTLYPAQTEDGLAIRVKGSPELTEPKVFELAVGMRAPRQVTLIPTGKNAKPARGPASVPAPTSARASTPAPAPTPAPRPSAEEEVTPQPDGNEKDPFGDTEAA